MRRLEQYAADLLRIVNVGGDQLGVAAVVLAKQVPRHPFRILAKDLVIDVLEKLQLNRLARTIDGLNPVDHRAPYSGHEVPVEERDRPIQPSRDLGLPVLPAVEIEVPAQ